MFYWAWWCMYFTEVGGWRVPGQPGQHGDSLSKNEQNNKQTEQGKAQWQGKTWN